MLKNKVDVFFPKNYAPCFLHRRSYTRGVLNNAPARLNSKGEREGDRERDRERACVTVALSIYRSFRHSTVILLARSVPGVLLCVPCVASCKFFLKVINVFTSAKARALTIMSENGGGGNGPALLLAGVATAAFWFLSARYETEYHLLKCEARIRARGAWGEVSRRIRRVLGKRSPPPPAPASATGAGPTLDSDSDDDEMMPPDEAMFQDGSNGSEKSLENRDPCLVHATVVDPSLVHATVVDPSLVYATVVEPETVSQSVPALGRTATQCCAPASEAATIPLPDPNRPLIFVHSDQEAEKTFQFFESLVQKGDAEVIESSGLSGLSAENRPPTIPAPCDRASRDAGEDLSSLPVLSSPLPDLTATVDEARDCCSSPSDTYQTAVSPTNERNEENSPGLLQPSVPSPPCASSSGHGPPDASSSGDCPLRPRAPPPPSPSQRDAVRPDFHCDPWLNGAGGQGASNSLDDCAPLTIDASGFFHASSYDGAFDASSVPGLRRTATVHDHPLSPSPHETVAQAGQTSQPESPPARPGAGGP